MEVSQNYSTEKHLKQVHIGDLLLAVNGTSFCCFSESLLMSQWLVAYREVKMPRLICFFRPAANGESSFIPVNVIMEVEDDGIEFVWKPI